MFKLLQSAGEIEQRRNPDAAADAYHRDIRARNVEAAAERTGDVEHLSRAHAFEP